ncbi:hypothetical protein V8C35DRAFT_252962 [Trichoderma chlorosporum]
MGTFGNCRLIPSAALLARLSASIGQSVHPLYPTLIPERVRKGQITPMLYHPVPPIRGGANTARLNQLLCVRYAACWRIITGKVVARRALYRQAPCSLVEREKGLGLEEFGKPNPPPPFRLCGLFDVSIFHSMEIEEPRILDRVHSHKAEEEENREKEGCIPRHCRSKCGPGGSGEKAKLSLRHELKMCVDLTTRDVPAETHFLSTLTKGLVLPGMLECL